MEIQEQRQGDGFDGLARGVGDMLEKAEKVIEDATKRVKATVSKRKKSSAAKKRKGPSTKSSVTKKARR